MNRNNIAARARFNRLLTALDQLLDELESVSSARPVQIAGVCPPETGWESPGGEPLYHGDVYREPLHVESTRELIEKVEPLLRSGNPECLKYMDQLRSIPGSENLVREMDASYFGVAAEILEEIKNAREAEHAKGIVR